MFLLEGKGIERLSLEVAPFRPPVSKHVSPSHPCSCNSQGLTGFSCPFISLTEIPYAHQFSAAEHGLSCREHPS